MKKRIEILIEIETDFDLCKSLKENRIFCEELKKEFEEVLGFEINSIEANEK